MLPKCRRISEGTTHAWGTAEEQNVGHELVMGARMHSSGGRQCVSFQKQAKQVI